MGLLNLIYNPPKPYKTKLSIEWQPLDVKGCYRQLTQIYSPVWLKKYERRKLMNNVMFVSWIPMYFSLEMYIVYIGRMFSWLEYFNHKDNI